MDIPDYQTLALPALRHLAESPFKTSTLIGVLSDEFSLNFEQRQKLLPSGRQPVINNRVHWSLAYLNRAGLIERIGRGEYKITTAGLKLMEAPPDKITVKFLAANYPSLSVFLTGITSGVKIPSPLMDSPPIDPEESLLTTSAYLRTALTAELLDRVRALTPAQFEALMVGLLLALGFGGGNGAGRGETLGMSGDGGVDGVMREDALGLDVVYIQAKRYAATNAVGPEAIQGFAGSLLERGATKGVFATTSRFTDGAKRAAERLSTQRRIVLIDGDELARLMIEHGVGVRTVQTIRIQRVDLSDYEDED